MILSYNHSPESGFSSDWLRGRLTEFIIKDSVHSMSPQWSSQGRLYPQVSGKKPAEARRLDTAEREERHVSCFSDSIFHGNTSKDYALCMGKGDVFCSQWIFPFFKINLFFSFWYEQHIGPGRLLDAMLSVCCASVTPRHWWESIFHQNRVKSQVQLVILALVRLWRRIVGSRWAWDPNQNPVSKQSWLASLREGRGFPCHLYLWGHQSLGDDIGLILLSLGISQIWKSKLREYKGRTPNSRVLNCDNANVLSTAPQKTANAGEDVGRSEPRLTTSGIAN